MTPYEQRLPFTQELSNYMGTSPEHSLNRQLKNALTPELRGKLHFRGLQELFERSTDRLRSTLPL